MADIYQWVKKYNELGEDGLKFLSKGRPSKKEQKELTELEKKDKEIEKYIKYYNEKRIVTRLTISPSLYRQRYYEHLQ